MNSGKIELRQSISAVIVFLIGSNVIMGVNTSTGHDSWLSFTFGFLMVLPIIFIYSRIIKLFPEKDIYDITVELFGNIAGTIINIIFIWYAIHLGSMVLRNFAEFAEIVALPETPQLPLSVLLILVAIYLAKSGLKALGKWSIMGLLLIISVVTFTIIFSFKEMNFANILPIKENTLLKISADGYKSFSFPLAETVVFLCIASYFKKNISPYKIYFYPIILGYLVLLIILLRNLFILGPIAMEAMYFPSYAAARVINIGNFLTRIEGSISFNFIIAGITKIAICILASAKGMKKIFKTRDEKAMIFPVSLLILGLSPYTFKNAVEMFESPNFYQFYAIPYQVLIPLIIWITAEIKHRAKKQP